MIFVVALALALGISENSQLHSFVSSHAPSFHKKCTNLLPKTSNQFSALNSLVCGEKITDKVLEQRLLQTSLIHLFVISGSHLILIDQLFSKLAFPFFLRFLLLSFYSFIALAEPPVIRALISLGAREFAASRWYLKSDLMVLITGLLTLVFFPNWKDSLSLQLSWAAALALCLPSLIPQRHPVKKIFLTQIAVFLLVAPLLWGFGSLHPLSLIFNIFLGPVIALFLLPLGVLIMIFPAVTPLFDGTVDLFSQVMHLFSEPILLPATQPLPKAYLWIWIGVVHSVFYLLRLFLKQGKDRGL